jgi:protein-disulfide isomerase
MATSNTPILVMTPPLAERDHVLGPIDGKKVLVEYGDFQCPHCRLAADVIEQLIEKLGDEMTFAFRHFPLVRVHPDAHRAAQAAEAAGAQGKFWEMHWMLFEHQDALGAEDLAKYARDLGLDVERFRSELSSGKYMQRVQEDIASGIKSGVGGTPTFFVNGNRHVGGFKFDALLAALNESRG